MRLLLCCAMSAGLFLYACSATQPVRPDKAGSIAPTQNVVVIRGLEGEGDVQRAPPAVVRRLEVEERNNRQVQKLYADYLEAPHSEKAHHMLHTHYSSRPCGVEANVLAEWDEIDAQGKR